MKTFTYGLLFLCLACSTYTDSQSTPTTTYIHKYGVPVSKAEWEKRGRDGSVIETLDSGAELTQKYEDGVLHGVCTTTFPYRNTIDTLEEYDRGKLVRKVVHYSSGLPKREETYSVADHKTIKGWYEEGTPQFVETYFRDMLVTGAYHNKENDIDARVEDGSGTRIYRDAFGQRVYQDAMENGLIQTRTRYHISGTPESITPYVEGLAHGQKRIFSPAGEPIATETWVDGEQTGITTLYDNGERIAEIDYVAGKKHGQERRYRSNVVVEEQTWANNMRHGPTKVTADGQNRILWHHRGKAVSKLTFDELEEVR